MGATASTRRGRGSVSRRWAGPTLTGALHASVEDALADEAGSAPWKSLLPVPAGPDADGDDDDTADPNAQLRQDIANLRGQTVMVETTSAGWGEGRTAAPMADWRPQRLGAAPGAPLVDLRDSSAQSVMAACGVPPTVFATGGDAAGSREAWRALLHGAVQPVADLLAAELAVKLDTPGLALTFDRLKASDVQGRARAFQSLTGGGMDAARAAELAGLT